MADRIAVSRIVSGHGESRQVIEPGSRFDTKAFGIDDATLQKMDASGALRRPRDPPRSAPAAAEPAAADPDAPETTTDEPRRRRRHANSDLDL
jgi:hypothetical protein